MDDELSQYLVDELGFERSKQRRSGLEAAIRVFLGSHLEQRTSIQEQAIEIIYDGADVLLISATASGKTEAAVIPVAARLLVDTGHSAAVYVAPTRALLNDLHRRLETPLAHLGLTSRLRHGDYPLPEDAAGTRVIFTTPESLDVLLSKNHPLLKHVRYAILDEIHQVFGTPRGDQLVFLLERLERTAEERVQRIALSATVGDPAQVASWLCPGRPSAQIIVAPGSREIVADVRFLANAAMLGKWLQVSGRDKILYFVNSRRRCDDVYLALRNVPPYQALVHYSTLTKEQREYVENSFKSSPQAVCVATSTLELGIDIGTIEEVVLVDPPTSVSSFLQRIGRGSRRGSYSNVVMTPRSPLDLVQFVALLELAEAGQVETGTIGHPYSVLAQQVFSYVASKRRLNFHIDELIELFGRCSWLDFESVERLLDSLTAADLLRKHPTTRVYEVGPGLESLFERGQIYSNIVGESRGIQVFYQGRSLAQLPLLPNQIRHGNTLLFAGRYWRITGIANDGLVVELSQAVPNPVRPTWGSKGIFAASRLLAQGMRAALLEKRSVSCARMEETCVHILDELRGRIPTSRQTASEVWHEKVDDHHLYYTFVGSTANQILALLFDELGMPCRPVRYAEGIALVAPELLDFSGLTDDHAKVDAAILANWRHFGSQISVGPYFERMPADLRRDETVAQIATSEVVHAVASLKDAAVVPVRLGLLNQTSAR